MGDRTRLFLTGIAAAGAIAVAVAAPPWNWFDDHDAREQTSVPLASLRDFDGIMLEGPDDVVVTPGDRFAVTIEGDGGAQRYLNLYVKDGVLHVGRRRHGWGGDATVHVTMPGLTRLWLAGSGDMQVARVGGKEFRILSQGPGDLKVDDVQSEAVRLTVQGPGDIALGGHTGEFSVNVEGPGDVVADELEAKKVDVTVSGPGDVRARATDNARLVVNGSGSAQVSGTTQCQIERHGPGDAECTT